MAMLPLMKSRCGSALRTLGLVAVALALLVYLGRQAASWYFLEKGGRILSLNLAREKDHTPALYWLRLAEATDPSNPLLHLYLGLYLTKSGDPGTARSSFERFGQLAEEDLGYFFRVLYSPAGPKAARITANDLETYRVSPSTALLLAWFGIHRMDPTLVQAALGRASKLDGTSFGYHLASGQWALRSGDTKRGLEQLERSLAVHDQGHEDASSGLGFLPFSFQLAEDGPNMVPRVSEWMGQVVTHPDAVNLMTAQLLALLTVLSRHQGQYQRSIQWAELVKKRYPRELARLGLGSQMDQYIYPLNFWSDVTRAAARFRLDPLLILALAREESHFNPHAVSQVGARGLMQIMPKTGSWIAGQLKWGGFSDDVLVNPSDNIEFGAYYLSHLIGQVGSGADALPWVLAAYNGGIGNARRWMASAPTGSAAPGEAIEFKETRDYIDKVLNSYRWYQRIHGSVAKAAVPGPDPAPAPGLAPGSITPTPRPAGTGRQVRRNQRRGR
ncbi:MAG: lytic transglycosylase domain-containing protein [Candidatus Riflebacteria bacterium]|nr:lytic transglycosylase domain-containing protein [Candidatus Riflebacteria bacterium]